MSEMVFCYSCRVHHPREHMTQVQTRQGLRWRCLQSVMAAQRAPQERDAFGRRQTELNRLSALHQLIHMTNAQMATRRAV